MSVRAHITLMLVATIFSWLGWLLVIINVNPYEAAWWGFALFYALLFLCLFGTFSVVGYTIRSVMKTKRVTIRFRITTAFRQSLLWSTSLIIALALQGQRLLTWWIFVIVIVVFVLIESIIMSIRQHAEENA